MKRDVPIKEKAILEQLYSIMRKDIAALKEPKVDCSGMLRATEVFDENKQSFSFVTERIVCSLADILHHFDGIPAGVTDAQKYLDRGGTLSEVEISRGLLNITEALQFMHHIQKKLHCAVCPENIVIVPGGQWKLCGFGHCLQMSGEEFRTASPYFISPLNSASVIRLEPDLRYSAGEMTFGGYNPTSARMVGPAADTFSLGVVIYEMYRYCIHFAQHGRSNQNLIPVTNNAVPGHAHALENSLQQLDLSCVPDTMQTLMKKVLMSTPESRAVAIEIINHPAFSSGTLAVLRAIDTLGSKDIGTQASQLNTLPGLLVHCPPRLLEGAVLLTVSKLCVQSPGLWVYSLPLHVFIAERISVQSYQEVAGPHIKEGLSVTSPEQTMQAFLKNIGHLQRQFDVSFFKENVVGTLIKNALDKKGTGQLMALHILCEDNVRSKLDVQCLTEDVLPRVCREACKSTDIAVKMKALFFMALVSSALDDEYLTKNFVPSLSYILQNDRTSMVTMCVLGVYRAMASTGPDSIANAVLPALAPLLAEKNLNASQFEILVHTYYTMTKKLISLRTNQLGVDMIGPEIADTKIISDQELFSTALNVPPSLQEKPSSSMPGAPDMSGGARGLALPGTSSGGSGGLLLPGASSGTPQRSNSDSDGLAPPSYTPSLPSPPSYAPTPPPVANPPPVYGASNSSSLDSFYGEKPQPSGIDLIGASTLSSSSSNIGSTLSSFNAAAVAASKNEDEGKSRKSWFGFGGKNKEPEKAPTTYQPPSMGLPSAASSSSSNGGANANIDMGDFMASFAKSATTSASPMTTSAPTSFTDSNLASSTAALQAQIQQTQSQIAQLSGSSNNIGMMPAQSGYQPPMMNNMSGSMQGMNTLGGMTTGGMSMQQQQQQPLYGNAGGYGQYSQQQYSSSMYAQQQQAYQPPQMSATNAGLFAGLQQQPMQQQQQPPIMQQNKGQEDPFAFLS